MDGLIDAVQKGNPRIRQFDTSCFSGEYVTGGVTASYLEHISVNRSDTAKQQGDEADSEVMELHNVV